MVRMRGCLCCKRPAWSDESREIKDHEAGKVYYLCNECVVDLRKEFSDYDEARVKQEVGL